MRIYGDEASTQFKTFKQEPGILWGKNDLIEGDKKTFRRMTFSFFGNTDESITTQPKLYVHISSTPWSTFTGLLRKYCLPWRWKVAYLDQDNKSLPKEVLICTSVLDGELSDRLQEVVGQTLFVASLLNSNKYAEIFGQEYLRIPRDDHRCGNRIIHPLGEWAGLHLEPNSSDNLCHIYRIRGIFSLVMYHLLKIFSSQWNEVTLKSDRFSEFALVKRNEADIISKAGLILPN